MSEREAAQKAYQDLQKSKNPSAFDTMGAFNTYYAGWNVNSSMALPLDMGILLKKRQDSGAKYLMV